MNCLLNALKVISCFLLFFLVPVYAQNELRVATHNSFTIDKELIKNFEKQHQVRIKFIKLGDSGEMVNKLILTRNSPIIDVVYGIDNINQNKAIKAELFENFQSKIKTRYQMQDGLTAIDYGWVTINYHRDYFQSREKKLPQSLNDLTKPEFKNLLVVEHPATSSPGLAFLLATYEYLGPDQLWDFWKKLKNNGLKVTKGWSEAYQKEFSQNGGKYPLVISYFSSPAAEVFYSSDNLNQSPTENLWLEGSYFFQIEGIGIIKDTPQIDIAKKFVDFMLSEKVQTDLQTKMWMNPANVDVKNVDAFKHVGKMPKIKPFNSKIYSAEQIQKLIDNWIKIMRD